MADELVGLLATDEEYAMYWEPGEGGRILEAVQENARQIARLQAQQVRLLAEFIKLRPGRPGREFSEFAPDELSAAMRWTRQYALSRLRGARTMTSHVPEVLEALDVGTLDDYQATVLADAVHQLPDDAAHKVTDYVLARADGRNVSELRRVIRRAVLRFTPKEAEERRAEAREGRRVDFTPHEDGMAALWAFLPANEALTIHRRLDAFAREGVPGDTRTHNQRRADALVDLMLDPGRGEININVDVTVPAGALAEAGPAAPTAELAGYGTISADQARELAIGASYRPLTSPTNQKPTDTGDITRIAGLPAANPSTQKPADTGDITRIAGLPATSPSNQKPTDTGDITQVVALPAAGTPTDQHPGYRRILGDPKWRRLVTHPLTGDLLGVTPGTYRPAPLLTEFVRARDQYCVFPSCSWTARSCDIDHRVPYPEGATTAENLNCLCRHHHRLKHEAGWTLRKRGRSYVWINPGGIEYVKQPDPVAEPDPPTPPPDDPPPF